MSGEPPRPSQRQPQPRHEGTNSQWVSQEHNDKLQIRVVPYSPPRISSDGSASASSRPVSYSYADNNSPLGSPSGPPTRSDRGYIQGSNQEPWVSPGVSGLTCPLSSLTTASTDPDNVSASSRTSSPRPRSSRRPKRIISVNSDKTFSLVPQSESASSLRAGSYDSFQLSSTTPSSSWGRVSSNTFFVEDRSSSPLTPQAERRLSASPSSSPVLQLPHSKPIPIPGSSWSNRLRGSAFNVDKAADSKGKQPASVSPPTPDALPPLPEATYDRDDASPQLSSRGSFQTSESDSALSDRTNYKIYGESSPVAPPRRDRETTEEIDYSLPPSSSHSNYQILGESSSSNQSLSDHQRPPTNDSDANYVVLGGPSASCSSLASDRSRLRSEYSRESLVVAPLRPVKQRRSFDHSVVLKSRSRESLRRGSLTSIGTTLTQEAARALFATSGSVYSPGSPRWQGSWNSNPSLPPSNVLNAMATHPHQWSGPLSTVASESEGGSAPPSRSLSAFSGGDRRSSTHSRNLLSMSSSIAGLDEQIAASPRSVNNFPERPQPALNRKASRDPPGNPRLIRDHDEDGDGLADLDQLYHLPSRARLASFVSNSSSDRVLRSSGSTRSLNPFSLPAWARVYYGSGERRFLIAQASSESMRSLYNGSLYNDPPFNNFLNRSPSAERFKSSIRNPKRRPREAARDSEPGVEPTGSAAGHSDTSSRPSRAPGRVRSIARGVKKQTSSVWSPHLRRDRRSSRYSIWDPPSVVWSTESGFDWRRNQQVVLFVVGFVIPFAWMVAAFLPLPPKPQREMVENQSTNHLYLQHQPPQPSGTIDEIRYNSARWWRNLNRGMSIFGLLVLGAVITLIVVGIKQQWAS